MKRISRAFVLLLVAVLLFSACDVAITGPESKNGEAAMRPNIIENYDLKVFLQEQDVYAKENLFAMYYAIAHFEKTCYLPYPMPQERAQALLSILCGECPELFQIDLTQPTSYHSYEGSSNVIAVDFPYCMDKDTYDTLLTKAKNALAEFDTEGMTLLEAEKYIYDRLSQNISYSKTAEHCENVYGALVKGKAKCDGIAKAMKWAMEYAGFSCMFIDGLPYDDGVGHAWNIVPVDGHYYHVDLTADVEEDDQKDPLYPAYNVSYPLMVSRYAPSTYYNIKPEYSMDASYHALAGNYFDVGDAWEEGIKERFLAAYKKGGMFTVQFSTSVGFDYCKDALRDLFREAAEEAGLSRWSWTTTFLEPYHVISVQIEK